MRAYNYYNHRPASPSKLIIRNTRKSSVLSIRRAATYIAHRSLSAVSVFL